MLQPLDESRPNLSREEYVHCIIKAEAESALENRK